MFLHVIFGEVTPQEMIFASKKYCVLSVEAYITTSVYEEYFCKFFFTKQVILVNRTRSLHCPPSQTIPHIYVVLGFYCTQTCIVCFMMKHVTFILYVYIVGMSREQIL